MNDKGINETLKKITEGSQKRKQAALIYDSAQPIAGTLAETYLVEHRHLPKESLQHTQFKYDKKSNSLVTPIYDSRNVLTGIQLIHLDKFGQKISAGNAKIVLENRQTVDQFGRVAMVRQGTDLTRIYIAEGVETAASLLSIIPEEFTVVASLGIKELTSSIPYIRSTLAPGAKVVWLADNDDGNEEAEKQFLESKAQFIKADFKIGQDLFIIAPQKKGTDWNDLLGDTSISLRDSFEESERALEKEYNALNTAYIIDEPFGLLAKTPYEDAEEQEMIEKTFAETAPVRKNIILMEELANKIQEYKSLTKVLEKIDAELVKFKTKKIDSPSSLSQAERDLTKINQIIINVQRVLKLKTDQKLVPQPGAHKEKLEQKMAEKALEIELCEQAFKEIFETNEASNLIESKTAFSKYFAKFDKEQKHNFNEGTLKSHRLREIVLEIHKKNKSILSDEIEEIKKSQLQDSIAFLVKNMENSADALMQTKAKIAKRQQHLEKQHSSLLNDLEMLYLDSLSSEQDIFLNVTLQGWYNNLSALKCAKPITYTLEPFGHAVELEHVELITEEEPHVEVTIEELAKDIIQRSGMGKILETADGVYERAIKDYAYKLAMNMHLSFKVKIPCDDLKQEQEFDGIAKRTFTKEPSKGGTSDQEYVILERKTNNGTRQGAMQTAFTQDKINSKMMFLKGVLNMSV